MCPSADLSLAVQSPRSIWAGPSERHSPLPLAALLSLTAFLSPMGEPFRGVGPTGDGLADWFNQADRNHDGSITVDEMEADADRFFATLDTNHDGEIDPDEVTNYETVVAPEVQGEPQSMYAPKPDGNANAGGMIPDSGDDGSDIPLSPGRQGPEGAGRFALLNIPEPVAAADSDLSRGITATEFRKAAYDRFGMLDTNHAGRLTLSQLETLRPSSPLGGFRRHGGHRRQGH
jgi:Ca2+-binding EF-hand superfamily protein